MITPGSEKEDDVERAGRDCADARVQLAFARRRGDRVEIHAIGEFVCEETSSNNGIKQWTTGDCW